MLVIAVHGGAGTHSISKDAETLIKKGLKEACGSGQRSFRAKQDACQAVQDCIVAMEDNHQFNAGTGSNLTITGTVECDASIMNSVEDFGAVGATSGIKNPIKAAYRILLGSQRVDPHGRIPPMLLSATVPPPDLAVDPSEMITQKALSDWDRWSAMIQTGQQSGEVASGTIVQDTVGAIMCTIDGEVSAGVSSGGYSSNLLVGLASPGAGELIMRAFLAKELAERVRQRDCDIHEEIERVLNNFVEMCAERGSEHANAGAILIVARLWCGFTTRSFAIAYASSLDSSPKSVILRRTNREPGKPGLYITSLPLD
ncbi:asparaginase [Rhizoctonia solani]|uniref:Asparaginase n=1 Tax=Rhizoctonia solani TaxID=456999 RepID=A0A8H8NZ80_9AGAM|nr:asparaginase [Rhizoctonia solani]QRW21442.1 asparaginase [Rhizoctonia solani]